MSAIPTIPLYTTTREIFGDEPFLSIVEAEKSLQARKFAVFNRYDSVSGDYAKAYAPKKFYTLVTAVAVAGLAISIMTKTWTPVLLSFAIAGSGILYDFLINPYLHKRKISLQIGHCIEKLPKDTLQSHPVPRHVLIEIFPHLDHPAVSKMHLYQLRDCYKVHPKLIQRKLEKQHLSRNQMIVWNKIFQLQKMTSDQFVEACESDDFFDETQRVPHLLEGVLQHLPKHIQNDDRVREILPKLVKKCLFNQTATLEATEEGRNSVVEDVISGEIISAALKKAATPDIEEKDVDEVVTIYIGDLELKISKRMLISKSAVFQSMLTSGMQESRENVIKLSDINPKAFIQTMRWLEEERCEINPENVEHLLNIASRFCISNLRTFCEDFLIRYSDAIDPDLLLELARDYYLFVLKDRIVEMLKCRISKLNATSKELEALYQLCEKYELESLASLIRQHVWESLNCLFSLDEHIYPQPKVTIESITRDIQFYSKQLDWFDQEEQRDCLALMVSCMNRGVHQKEDLPKIWEIAVQKEMRWVKKTLAGYCREYADSMIVRLAWFTKPRELLELIKESS